MADPLGLRAEANQHPWKQKDLPVWWSKAKQYTAGRDPAHYVVLYPFFLDDEMKLREVEDLHTEVCGNQ